MLYPACIETSANAFSAELGRVQVAPAALDDTVRRVNISLPVACCAAWMRWRVPQMKRAQALLLAWPWKAASPRPE